MDNIVIPAHTLYGDYPVSYTHLIKDFYQFTTDDIKITDYVTGEQIKDIPIAV